MAFRSQISPVAPMSVIVATVTALFLTFGAASVHAGVGTELACCTTACTACNAPEASVPLLMLNQVAACVTTCMTFGSPVIAPCLIPPGGMPNFCVVAAALGPV
mmetsp:Transcript_25093/g.77561  ORF Transcript_25093/g.77561 Transcript_25093/m.77561 type:complete len:104 (-) Transcript_25093:238-549(-)